MIDLKAIIEFFKKESDIYDRKKLEIEKEKERLKMPEVDNDPEKMKFEIENMSEKQLRVFSTYKNKAFEELQLEIDADRVTNNEVTVGQVEKQFANE